MIDLWNLPTSLNIGGVEWHIRTDFRAILDILAAFEDPNYEEDVRTFIAFDIFFEDFKDMPRELYQEAGEKMVEFIDMGASQDGRPSPKTMDWTQDASLVIPAINKVVGQEIRAIPYMHWWTFIGAYMEIDEGSLFSRVVSIRSKKAHHKKMEKWEEDFYKEHKKMIDIKKKYSDEELERQSRLNALLG